LLTIDFIHKKNIVHRDLKLENVLVNNVENEDLNIKIADFGMASFLPENDRENIKFFCGTPGYMAPEVFHGFGYREKVDIFSAGCIMFNLVTGNELFSGNDANMILYLN